MVKLILGRSHFLQGYPPYINTDSLTFRSNNRHQLPSDPLVAKNALAYSLSFTLAR